MDRAIGSIKKIFCESFLSCVAQNILTVHTDRKLEFSIGHLKFVLFI